MFCDVRLMAATSADLEEALANRRLREELYYRLSAFTVQVPPLRQRASEIPQLLAHFMKQLAAQYAMPMRVFPQVIVESCQSYSWPGNLRELEGLVKRYLVMGDEQLLFSELRRNTEGAGRAGSSLPKQANRGPLSGLRSLVQSVKGEAEKNAITLALEETHWNRKAAARLLSKLPYIALQDPAVPHESSRVTAAPFPGQPITRAKAVRSFASPRLRSRPMKRNETPRWKLASRPYSVWCSPGVDGAGEWPNRRGRQQPAPPAQKADDSYVIGPADVLAINVWKEAEISRSIPVRSDGRISLPLIGEVQAAGRTPRQLQEELAKKLTSFISEPDVTVIVQEIHSQKFNVLGQVGKPGTFLLTDSTTVLDAIALAGGFRDFAKQKAIYVLRQNARRHARLGCLSTTKMWSRARTWSRT